MALVEDHQSFNGVFQKEYISNYNVILKTFTIVDYIEALFKIQVSSPILTCNRNSQCKRCCNRILSILVEPVVSLTMGMSRRSTLWVSSTQSSSMSWIACSSWREMKSLNDPVFKPVRRKQQWMKQTWLIKEQLNKNDRGFQHKKLMET